VDLRLTKDSLVSTESSIADYKAIASTQARYAAMNGQQDGDPEKAAALFIRLAENPEPPLHLWLGGNAVDRAGEKIESLKLELEKWKGCPSPRILNSPPLPPAAGNVTRGVSLPDANPSRLSNKPLILKPKQEWHFFGADLTC
jgi:hypothetical protein